VDAQEEFWFYAPEALHDVMLVPEETLRDRISPHLDDELYLAVWYLVMDGSGVHPNDVVPLIARINDVQQRAAGLLPGLRLSVSPAEALRRYHSAARHLTLALYAVSVPILGVILVFIGNVTGLVANRRRNEIAVLRSRGATVSQVLGVVVLEGALLAAIALAVGLPAGEMIARVIGKARSFLDFTLHSDLRVAATMATVRYGVVAAIVAIVMRVVPTLGAARHTVVTYKQDRARRLRRPWWQRAWLDLLLLIPAAYGTHLLMQQGGIALSAMGNTALNEPFQNPLLFLVPALSVLALTLFALRVLPAVMEGIALLAARANGVGLLLATRYLSRTPGFYSASLILLVLTLSLSTFTASLAQTLDRYVHDRTYYEAGADVNLVALTPSLAPSDVASGPITTEEGARWVFRPLIEFLELPGVRAASRVGRYEAVTNLSGGVQRGTFLGIDRFPFSEVAFWRRDFAPQDLGTLMNALAVHPDGVLVPRSFMATHALDVGDWFRATVRAYGEATEWDLTIVGGFDLFPTWIPGGEEGPLFVGNLDRLFEQIGGRFPYRVWLATEPQVSYDKIRDGISETQLGMPDRDPSSLQIETAMQQPERQGLFGLLSVGFLAAAFLTVVGFLLYAFISFRRRFVELGVLRAVGLSIRQMTAFLSWELALLLLIGVVAGTGLGVGASKLYIPYLQVGSEQTAQALPFVVEIAWPAILRIYGLFALLFVCALAGLGALLVRMKVFEAIKLGETT
jgi:putative ABC transport system permease protein